MDEKLISIGKSLFSSNVILERSQIVFVERTIVENKNVKNEKNVKNSNVNKNSKKSNV